MHRKPPIVVRRSPIHGTGVFATRAIRPKEEIIEYTGKRITTAQAEEGEDNGHTFLFTLNAKWVIEAAIKGNDARWINHSCRPNCEAVVIKSRDHNPRHDYVMISALRQIRRGEELTYDYGILTDEPIDAEMRKLWRCRCGARNCKGIMLAPEY